MRTKDNKIELARIVNILTTFLLLGIYPITFVSSWLMGGDYPYSVSLVLLMDVMDISVDYGRDAFAVAIVGMMILSRVFGSRGLATWRLTVSLTALLVECCLIFLVFAPIAPTINNLRALF